MLIGTQPPLGLEPVLVGPPFRSAALFPKPIGEFLLFSYVDLRAHDSSPSVFLDPRSNWKTPFERMIARMHGLCQRRKRRVRRRLRDEAGGDQREQRQRRQGGARGVDQRAVSLLAHEPQRAVDALEVGLNLVGPAA